MPSIFLVNDNKIVSRLLQLSSDKHNYLLEEKATIEPSKERYDFVLVDSDKYSSSLVEKIQTKLTYKKIGFIGIKNEPVPDVFDMHLDKPFLPSDFVTMIEQNSEEESFDTVQDASVQPKREEPKNNHNTEELDLEELTIDDNIEDLELDESTIDLDLESEEPLEELDTLDDLDTLLNEPDEEDSDIDLALDGSSVMSTGVAPQYVQTSEDEDNTPHEELANIINEIEDIDSTKEITLEESKEQLEDLDDLDDLSETVQKDTESDIVNTTLAAGATALAGAAFLSEDESSKNDSKPDITSLNNLESVEELEKESHYIDKESLAEDMTDNLDTLNEDEINKALHKEPTDMIVDQKIDQATEEETLVESNDVQKWIQDAVAKAITPEMIKEALNDMQINITLDFTKKDT